MSVKKLPATQPTVEMGAAPGQSWLVSHDTVDMTRRAPAVRPLTIAAEPQNIVVDANKCALLIVDMQNDFCCVGGWLDFRGIDISPNRKPIEPIRKLVAAFRREKLPVVWVNWGVRKDLLNIHPSLRHAHSPRGDEPGLAEPVPGTRSEVISRGSWGAEVVDEINPGTADIQIVKHRFSAFWDTETDLDPAQPRRQDAADRRRQHGPVRDDDARGCELPRLRHDPRRGRDGDDVARFLRPGRPLQCEAAVRLRDAVGRDPVRL